MTAVKFVDMLMRLLHAVRDLFAERLGARVCAKAVSYCGLLAVGYRHKHALNDCAQALKLGYSRRDILARSAALYTIEPAYPVDKLSGKLAELFCVCDTLRTERLIIALDLLYQVVAAVNFLGVAFVILKV